MGTRASTPAHARRDWVHQQVLGATKRGRRIVVTGDLWIKLRKDGTYRTKKIDAELPKRKS